MSTSKKTVCVIGLWHLGLVNAVGFAEKGYNVVGLEFDSGASERIQKGILPLFEPGLQELVEKHIKAGFLSFTSDVSIVQKADYVVIAYDSPVNDQDEVDISPVVKAADRISSFLKSTTPVIITSQIPVGSSEMIQKSIQKKNLKWKSGVIYTPENLRLGKAIELFLQPDMLVLGTSYETVRKQALALYAPFETKKFTLDLKSAEMVKHAINVYLATCITFSNEIANLASRLGADAKEVGQVLKADKRIGSAPVLPGLGFSGGTLARDVKQLLKFSKEYEYDAPLLKSIIKINEGSFDEVIQNTKKVLKKLEGKTIGILGLTYKPGTSTLRRSPSLKIIQKLLKEKSKCIAYDPKANLTEVPGYEKLFTVITDYHKLFEQSDAVILVTEWPEFREFDFKKLSKKMRKPILIDSKNFLDMKALVETGFQYIGYGREEIIK